MSGSRQRGRRHLSHVLAGALATLIIVIAALMILVQLSFPLLAHYPKQVAALVSEGLHEPVTIGSIDAHWEPSGPVLIAHDVSFGGRSGQQTGTPAMTVPRLRIKLDLGAWISSTRHWLDMRIEGLHLTAVHERNGQWHIAGLGAAQGSGGTSAMSLPPGVVVLADSHLAITEASSGNTYALHIVALRVRSDGTSLRFRGTLHRGDARAPLRVAGRIANDGSTGRLWLDARNVHWGNLLAGIDLHGYTVRAGQGDAAVWLRWQQGNMTRVTVQTALHGVVIGTGDALHYLPVVHGLVQLRHDDPNAASALGTLNGAALWAHIVGTGSVRSVQVRLNTLDIANWAPLAGLLPTLPDSLQHWLAASSPHGTIAQAGLRWSGKGGLEHLQVQFKGLGFKAVAGTPGMNHLDGTLLADATTATLHVPQQPLTLDFGGLFPQPLDFLATSGNITAWQGPTGWTLGSGGMQFHLTGANGTLRGRVRLHGASGLPFVALYVALDHADVAQAHRYLPVGIMPPHTVQWLDHALVSGTIESGHVIVRGNLADWPFTDHKGRFEARAAASDFTLNYEDGWPPATGVSAVVSFVDDGMDIAASRGHVHGITVSKAEASIPDLGNATLHLSAHGSGSGKSLLHFVRNSPVGRPYGDALKGLTLGGTGKVEFALKIPLADDTSKGTTLAGTVQLHNADIADPAWSVQLGDVSGPLAFNVHGVSASGLHATFHGQPVTLGLQVGHVDGHPGWPVKVSMHGRMSVAQLLTGYKSLQPLLAMVSGSGTIDVGFHVDPKAANDVHRTQVLNVRSDLVGIALNLPAPLHKTSNASLPLDVTLGLPFDAMHVNVRVGSRLQARAQLADTRGSPLVVGVNLGSDAKPTLPQRGIRIRGEAEHVDISGWVRQLAPTLGSTGGTTQALPPLDVTVVADHAEIFDSDFGKLALQLRAESGRLEVNVKGANMEGTVTMALRSGSGRGIVANFDRLYWPKQASAAATGTGKAPTPPAAPPNATQAANVGIAPGSLPAINFQVGQLHIGDAHLGQVRLKTQPTPQGLRIAVLSAHSTVAKIDASGQWNGTATNSNTHMQVKFASNDLGKALDAFGFKGVIMGAPTEASLKASWPGAPFSFALANLAGTMKMTLGEGRIPEISPGVGRLLGLFSIAQLPRRLSLDFGDVFEKGLSFDSVTASFDIGHGSARTQDFILQGPSLDMHMKGRIGLRGHDYDVYVTAIPHVGVSLPIVGAVVGGPIGAAAGLAIQGLLGHSLSKTAAVTYHVTGPWENPKIEKVGAKNHATKKKPAKPSPSVKPGQNGTRPPTLRGPPR